MRTDGGLKTGRDIVMAAMMGAEEYGMGTSSLVAMGCIMVRQCHSKTCPVGVCSQDKALREKFTGTPEKVVNLFNFVATEVREILASLGFKSVNEIGLSLQEGGRVINLCDKVSKSQAMKNVVKVFKKVTKEKLFTIGVGDNYNDLDMLKNSDIPCLVFNDKFTLEKININNCLVSKKPAPEGWKEVVKIALDKIK